MKRKTAKNLVIDSNIRAKKIYPIETSVKQLIELKTVAFKLTRDQAVHLAITLLAASRNWDEIDVTGFRFSKRSSDGTYIITVTSKPAHETDT